MPNRHPFLQGCLQTTALVAITEGARRANLISFLSLLNLCKLLTKVESHRQMFSVIIQEAKHPCFQALLCRMVFFPYMFFHTCFSIHVFPDMFLCVGVGQRAARFAHDSVTRPYWQWENRSGCYTWSGKRHPFCQSHQLVDSQTTIILWKLDRLCCHPA